MNTDQIVNRLGALPVTVNIDLDTGTIEAVIEPGATWLTVGGLINHVGKLGKDFTCSFSRNREVIFHPRKE